MVAWLRPERMTMFLYNLVSFHFHDYPDYSGFRECMTFLVSQTFVVQLGESK